MTTFDVVKKLTGSFYPVGDSNEDDNRRRNLGELIGLSHEIILAIKDVANVPCNGEHSIELMKQMANRHLVEINEIISEY